MHEDPDVAACRDSNDDRYLQSDPDSFSSGCSHHISTCQNIPPRIHYSYFSQKIQGELESSINFPRSLLPPAQQRSPQRPMRAPIASRRSCRRVCLSPRSGLSGSDRLQGPLLPFGQGGLPAGRLRLTVISAWHLARFQNGAPGPCLKIDRTPSRGAFLRPHRGVSRTSRWEPYQRADPPK